MEMAEGARPERRWQKTETPPTYRRWQSDKPIDSASSQEIPMILKAFVATASSSTGCEVLHQAADEGLVCAEEFRCAKEGLCMTGDAQSEAGFGGQL